MSCSSAHEPLGFLEKQIEALLFVAGQPVSVKELSVLLDRPPVDIERSVRRIEEHYAAEHGLLILHLAGGLQMATIPEVSEVVETFREGFQSQRIHLSKASLETLAVIAYNQPTTRADIEEIRKVRCDRVIDTLLKHGLIRVAGRKKSTGMPLLYRTTDRFLELFGLDSLSDLPSLEDLAETNGEEKAGFEISDDHER